MISAADSCENFPPLGGVPGMDPPRPVLHKVGGPGPRILKGRKLVTGVVYTGDVNAVESGLLHVNLHLARP